MIDVSVPCHYTGDCRELLALLPEGSVQTCVTSPPYWGLRDYGHEGQIGLEPTPEAYVAALVGVFRGVRRAMRSDGTLWLILGDCYAGSGRGGYVGGRSRLQGSIDGQDQSRHAKRRIQTGAGYHATAVECGAIGKGWVPPPAALKNKDLIGIPWRVAFALQADGWYLRQDIVWSKPNPMPESVRDRCTRAHEYIFLMSASRRYYFDATAIAEPALGGHYRNVHDPEFSAVPGAGSHRGIRNQQVGRDARNKRSVWTVAAQPYDGAHFAVFPPRLVEPCILAGSRNGDLVLDPFFGSGTTGQVAEKHGRRWIGFDLGYEDLAKQRTSQRSLTLESP